MIYDTDTLMCDITQLDTNSDTLMCDITQLNTNSDTTHITSTQVQRKLKLMNINFMHVLLTAESCISLISTHNKMRNDYSDRNF